MTDKDRLKVVALRHLANRYPRANESEHGNDWMNGCWQGLMNFCKETGLVSEKDLEEYRNKPTPPPVMYVVDKDGDKHFEFGRPNQNTNTD